MIWITGNSGAGKTTLAEKLFEMIPNSIVLDGNTLRDIWIGLGFSELDRREQSFRTVKLATYLERQGYNVIVSVICPYKDLRKTLDDNFKIFWIKLRGGKKPSKEYPYED